MQMGGVCLVTWTVLCFQFHTHPSLQHSKASCYFQTVAELHLSVHDLCPSFCSWFMPLKALPLCPNWDWRESAHAQMFTACRYTFENSGFNGQMDKFPLLQNCHYHWRELPQVPFLLQQTCVCCDKHVFVMTKHIFCRHKTSGATDILVRQT